MASTRHELSLKERVKVIEYARKNPRVGSCAIAPAFGCGKTQIQVILKNRETILEEYESNATPASRKRHRHASLEDVDQAMYKWFCLARQRSVPVSGPMIQEEARLVAEKMGHLEFKASKGWLSTFKKRHNI